MRADEPMPEFEIDLTPIWPVDDSRLEPVFLADETGAVPGASEREKPAPPPRQRASALSPVGSFAVHLATLLCLLGWSEAPAEIGETLPVQLVLAEPEGPAEAETDAAPPTPDSEVTTVVAAQAAPAAPDATPAPPTPAPPVKAAAIAPPPTKPTPPPDAAHRRQVAEIAPAPDTATSRAPSEMTESDYLAHLVALTRGHLDLLPLSFLAGRQGHTLLSVVVHDDGTIGRIAVKRSSGYPDIDSRIERVVAAVGRFPPPPGSLPRPSAELDFNLTFPDALQQ